GKVITPMGTGGNNLLASKRKFKKYGKSGLDVSDWLPHMATCADDLALLRACWADGLNHVGSVCQLNTGSVLARRPWLGSWSVYGLGAGSRILPGLVVLTERPGEVAGRGHRCLLARRLVERGVRFVQVYCRAGSQWDAHSDIEVNPTKMCGRADQAAAALIKDLKARGLLDSTLVIWGGEFGRTPMTEGNANGGYGGGRDHNPYGFSVWMAGAGIRGGKAIGATDEIGFRAAQDPIHMHDLHATIL